MMDVQTLFNVKGKVGCTAGSTEESGLTDSRSSWSQVEVGEWVRW